MVWFYNLLIGIGGLIIGMLAFTDEIATKISYFKNIKSLVFKLPFFVLGSVLILVGSIAKDNESESKAEKTSVAYKAEFLRLDSLNKANKKSSDSVYQIKMQSLLDSSYVKSIKASNEALAKYNLRFIDSLHSVASTINTKTFLAQLAIDAVDAKGTPPIYITDEGNGKILNVRYISSAATSYNIRINTYIVKEDPKGDFILQYILHPGGNESLVPDRNRTMALRLEPLVANSETLLIVFIGTFSRVDGGEKIKFNSAFSFNFKLNKEIISRSTIDYPAFEKYLDEANIPRVR
ncbi:MAG: hypothetical protein ABIN01_13970 [Ferruginibacter sp.]